MDDPVAIRTTIAGRWGPVFVAATDRGVVAVEWLTTEEAFDAVVSRRLGGRVARAGTVKSRGRAEKHLNDGVKWIEAFLSGRPARDAPPIDLSARPAWDPHVLGTVAPVPW